MAMVTPRKKKDGDNGCVYLYDRRNRSVMLRAMIGVSGIKKVK